MEPATVRRGLWVMLMMMVLLALYILSWGPSSWLFFNGHILEGESSIAR